MEYGGELSVRFFENQNFFRFLDFQVFRFSAKILVFSSKVTFCYQIISVLVKKSKNGQKDFTPVYLQY